MNPDTSSLTRTLLKVAGGALATYGAMSAADVANLIHLMEAAVGAALALWGAIWSAWANRPASKEAKQVAAAVIVAKVPITQEVAAAKAKA